MQNILILGGDIDGIGAKLGYLIAKKISERGDQAHLLVVKSGFPENTNHLVSVIQEIGGIKIVIHDEDVLQLSRAHIEEHTQHMAESMKAFVALGIREPRYPRQSSTPYLEGLEASGILNPIQRECVIDRVLALADSEVSLEHVKWIVLMVLWSHGQDYVFIEDFLAGDDEPRLH